MPRLRDGFSTLISLPGAGAIFWEIEVTPPGIDGGGPNDTTTMRNIAWRTRQPKKLKTLTAMSARVAYDPRIYNQLTPIVNVNAVVQVLFPEASLLTIWGWLDKFTPDRIREGEQPTAEMTIEPSNQDNEDPPVEQAPTLVVAS